jgi:hypothetical protein
MFTNCVGHIGEQRFLVYEAIKFLRGHVYTWETLYLHFLRNDVMHFDVSHSSAHEAMNQGLKSHSCAIKPIMNLDTPSNTMNIQSSIKVKECEDIIFQEATRTHKRWSDLPTSPYTTSVGEGNLQGVMSRVNHYVAKLVLKQTRTSRFQVCYTNTRTQVELQQHDEFYVCVPVRKQSIRVLVRVLTMRFLFTGGTQAY